MHAACMAICKVTRGQIEGAGSGATRTDLALGLPAPNWQGPPLGLEPTCLARWHARSGLFRIS